MRHPMPLKWRRNFRDCGWFRDQTAAFLPWLCLMARTRSRHSEILGNCPTPATRSCVPACRLTPHPILPSESSVVKCEKLQWVCSTSTSSEKYEGEYSFRICLHFSCDRKDWNPRQSVYLVIMYPCVADSSH